jgi:hypothetical protein
MTGVLIVAAAIAAAPLLAWCAEPVMIGFELGVMFERIRRQETGSTRWDS